MNLNYFLGSGEEDNIASCDYTNVDGSVIYDTISYYCIHIECKN